MSDRQETNDRLERPTAFRFHQNVAAVLPYRF